MSTMNVLICQKPKELVWKQREIPIPGDSEALIKIKSVGICGTDIHAWEEINRFLTTHVFWAMKYVERLLGWVKIYMI